MKKAIMIVLIAVFVITIIALVPGCKAQTAPTTIAVETTTGETVSAVTTAAVETSSEIPATGEKRVCRLWFWGEDEAPGITDYLKHVGELYTERVDSNVTWEIKHVDIDQLYTGFYASIEANDAPEIHMLWAGVMGLEPAWAGLLEPISDYVSEETLSHINPINRQEGYWNGKQWLVPLYIDPWLPAINRKVWADSGNDPDNLPTTWEGFVKALENIRDAGKIPWCVGIKDGFYGGWFPSMMQFQYYDSPTDYHKAIIGDEKLNEPPHDQWWYLLQELRDKKLFNSDANSLSLAEGQDLFLQGNVGLFIGVQPLISYYVTQMGEDTIGLTTIPIPDGGKNKGKISISSLGLTIPKAAKYKDDAGKFLELYLSDEIQNGLYEVSSIFPGTDWLKKDLMKNRQDEMLYDMVQNKAAMTYVWQHPGAMEEASYAITQEFLAGDIDAKEASNKYESAAEKWRNENPEALANFKIWASEDFPFLK